MFVAINFITCTPEYRDRFEELFASRAGEIDRMPGFQRLQVLRPKLSGEDYLIMSEWDDESSFKAWMKSDAFVAGHRRGFADLEAAKKRGEQPPMHSQFRTYEVLTR
jgi:heme-degrading monooxygenase HmoA